MSGSVEDISNEALTAKPSAENTSLQPIRRPPFPSLARILGLQTLEIVLSDCSGLTLHTAMEYSIINLPLNLNPKPKTM